MVDPIASSALQSPAEILTSRSAPSAKSPARRSRFRPQTISRSMDLFPFKLQSLNVRLEVLHAVTHQEGSVLLWPMRDATFGIV